MARVGDGHYGSFDCLRRVLKGGATRLGGRGHTVRKDLNKESAIRLTLVVSGYISIASLGDQSQAVYFRDLPPQLHQSLPYTVTLPRWMTNSRASRMHMPEHKYHVMTDT